jgi:hypothetical protein
LIGFSIRQAARQQANPIVEEAAMDAPATKAPAPITLPMTCQPQALRTIFSRSTASAFLQLWSRTSFTALTISLSGRSSSN